MCKMVLKGVTAMEKNVSNIYIHVSLLFYTYFLFMFMLTNKYILKVSSLIGWPANPTWDDAILFSSTHIVCNLY